MQRLRITIKDKERILPPTFVSLILGIISIIVGCLRIDSIDLRTKKNGVVLYTLTNFVNSDNGYDSVIAFQYDNDDDKNMFLEYM